jgi:hypothetical protein
LTTLTTAFYIDFLKKDGDQDSEQNTAKARHIIHFLFAVLLLLTILGIKALNNQAVIDMVFMVAGYTYGPLLGLFFMGIYTKRQLREKWVPLVAILTPLAAHSLKTILFLPGLVEMEASGSINFYNYCLLKAGQWLSEISGLKLHYKIGNELILINGLIMVIGLWLISYKTKTTQ